MSTAPWPLFHQQFMPTLLDWSPFQFHQPVQYQVEPRSMMPSLRAPRVTRGLMVEPEGNWPAMTRLSSG